MTAISDYKSVSFQDLRVLAHEQAQKTFDQEYPLAQNSLEKLGAFHSSLTARISELQHSKVTTPTKEKLLEEQETNLIAYWGFRETAQKAKELAKGLSAIVTFLTPQPRIYSDEESLKNEAPKLLKSLRACDEASLKLKSDVSNWWGKMDTLQIKMFEQLNTEVSYSLQKFCQIVNNEGMPLSVFTRGIDWCTTPVIPKPQSKEADLASSDGEIKNDMELGKEEKKLVDDTKKKSFIEMVLDGDGEIKNDVELGKEEKKLADDTKKKSFIEMVLDGEGCLPPLSKSSIF